MRKLKPKRTQCAAEKRARKIQLGNKRKELDDFVEQGTCTACGRAFEKDDNHHYHMRTLKQQLEACRLRLEQASAAFRAAEEDYETAKKEAVDYDHRLTLIQKAKSYQKIQSTLTNAQETFETLSKRQVKMKDKVDHMRHKHLLYNQTRTLLEQLRRSIDISESRLNDLRQMQCPHSTNNDEKQSTEFLYAQKCQRFSECQVQLNDAQAMAKWSGPRGIQRPMLWR